MPYRIRFILKMLFHYLHHMSDLQMVVNHMFMFQVI